MRCRNLRPDHFLNEHLAACSMPARYLWLALLCAADKCGRLEYRPARIRSECLPYDDIDIVPLVEELAGKFDADGRPALLCPYTCGGKHYLAIPSFKDEQRPHPKDPESKCPPPPEFPGNSTESPENNLRESPSRGGSGILSCRSLNLDRSSPPPGSSPVSKDAQSLGARPATSKCPSAEASPEHDPEPELGDVAAKLRSAVAEYIDGAERFGLPWSTVCREVTDRVRRIAGDAAASRFAAALPKVGDLDTLRRVADDLAARLAQGRDTAAHG